VKMLGLLHLPFEILFSFIGIFDKNVFPKMMLLSC
jgi:hypothetical protein